MSENLHPPSTGNWSLSTLAFTNPLARMMASAPKRLLILSLLHNLYHFDFSNFKILNESVAIFLSRLERLNFGGSPSKYCGHMSCNSAMLIFWISLSCFKAVCVMLSPLFRFVTCMLRFAVKSSKTFSVSAYFSAFLGANDGCGQNVGDFFKPFCRCHQMRLDLVLVDHWHYPVRCNANNSETAALVSAWCPVSA